MSELSLTSQTITNTTAITKVSGTTSSSNFDLIEDEFNKLLESGVTGLVLDISGLETITSSGLGAVINMSSTMKERRGKLVLAAPNPKIKEDLDMLQLGEALTIVETIDQAKKLIASIK